MRSMRRDGVDLFYEEAGGDGAPVLLVHGWCCDHAYFAPQFEHFANRGHRVAAVDLRGHGESDKPHQHYTMRASADDPAGVCERIDLAKPVVAGHSMGGKVAFDLAARYPGLPSAVVMLDAAVVLPAAARAAIPAFLEEARGPGYRETLRDYAANSLFIPTDGRERKVRILEGMPFAPRHVVVLDFEGLGDYDPAEAAGGLTVPAVYIAADEARPRSAMARFHELTPRILHGGSCTGRAWGRGTSAVAVRCARHDTPAEGGEPLASQQHPPLQRGAVGRTRGENRHVGHRDQSPFEDVRKLSTVA